MGDEVIEAMDRVIEEELTHPPHTVDARQVLRAALEAAMNQEGVKEAIGIFGSRGTAELVFDCLLQAVEPNEEGIDD